MIDLQGICSLSHFQRDARRHIRHMQKTGRPAILTVNGQAQVVVQDVKSYQALLKRAQEVDDLRRLARRLADVRAGRSYPAEAIFDELEVKHFGRRISRK